MNEAQLKAICDPTRLQVLGYLAEKPATNTEIYKKLHKVAYRESIFKALKKLKDVGLIKREFKEKEGYKYSLNFKELKIGKLVIISQK